MNKVGKIEIRRRIPPLEDYLSLRVEAGLS